MFISIEALRAHENRRVTPRRSFATETRMSPDNALRVRALRMLLMMDATVLVLLGAFCLARGVVTWPQASFGMFVAAFIASGY